MEETKRSKQLGIIKEDYLKYENEKEIKDTCKIKINGNYINFNYFYKFKKKENIKLNLHLQKILQKLIICFINAIH